MTEIPNTQKIVNPEDKVIVLDEGHQDIRTHHDRNRRHQCRNPQGLQKAANKN
jgi:hypothetical protein